MPEKRRLSLSFSLAQREQRDAWERLSAVAPGQRMDAVCRICLLYTSPSPRD